VRHLFAVYIDYRIHRCKSKLAVAKGKGSIMYLFVLEVLHRYRSLHAIRDHTELPGRGSISSPNPSCCYGRYSIYPPIKDERLGRPEPTQVGDLSRVDGYTRCQLVKPAFCPTRHGRREQLAHSCYVVTIFSGIRTCLFQTRVERVIHSATNVTSPALMLDIVSSYTRLDMEWSLSACWSHW